MNHHGIPRKEAIRSTFDRAASNFGQTGPRHFTHFGRRLVELASISPQSNVLDVATGRGAVLFPAAERVGPEGRVTAIDLAEGMLRQTAIEIDRKKLTNVDVRHMDAEALQLPADSFDCVLAGFALWFFDRPDIALSGFFRVLKPGGRLGLSTWERNTQFPYGFRDLIVRHLPSKDLDAIAPAVRFDSPQQLTSALGAAGFTAVDVRLEETTLLFADEEALWSTVGGGGMGRLLEMAGPDACKTIKGEVLEAVRPTRQPEGFPIHYRVLMAFGTKPV